MGDDFMFAIPSTTGLLMAPYKNKYIDILRKLIIIDQDINKISSSLYRCDHGIYSMIPDFTVI